MKIVFSLLLFLVFGLSAFGQTTRATSPKKETIGAAVQAGEFVFGIPADITSKQVKESAEYYTLYFTVEHLQATKQVRIIMKENTAKARHIIVRFFVSLGIREIMVNDAVLSVEDYYDQFLK